MAGSVMPSAADMEDGTATDFVFMFFAFKPTARQAPNWAKLAADAIGLNNVIHVVQTHNNGPGVNGSHSAGADGVAYQDLRAGENHGLQVCEDRADDGKCDVGCHKNRGERRYKQIQHLRDMLVQPFFNLTHQEYGKHDRNDVSLVSGLLDREDKDVPGGDSSLIAGHGPGVDKIRMNHEKTDNRAQEDIAAEYSRRGDGYDTGQEDEGCIGHHIQESVPVAGCKSRKRLTEGLHQAHHETGSDDSRQDRDKYVADRLQQLLPERLFFRRGCFDVVLGRRRHAGDRQEFVIYFVDRTGADDELQLSVGFEHALDAVDVLEDLFIDLAVVRNDQAQPGRAVRGADDV